MRKPSVRKRRFLKRVTGYGTEPLVRRARVALGREQRCRVAGVELVFPPSHKLPYYLSRDPRYDVYAGAVLARLADGKGSVRVIDIGANVGDTATIVLHAAPNISVRSVEGSPEFLVYARRNLTGYGDRCELIERYVGPLASRPLAYGHDGSTGGFGLGDVTVSGTADYAWVSPKELLEGTEADDLVVWKSDTDGLDIHLLHEHFEIVDEACKVIWFEYDPFETLGDPADIPELWRQLGESGRGLLVFDNLGNRMLSVPPGGNVERTLADLTAWLGEQRESHMEVAYFDLWALHPDVWFEVDLPDVEVRHT